MPDLRLTDAHDLRDWEVFTQRAQRLDPDGAMRLTVHGARLVLTVSPLYPHGLGDTTPLTLGMRIVPLPASDLDGLDAVVQLAALTDRFARARAQGLLHVPVPPQEVHAAWAGIAPPRGPWEPLGSLDAGIVVRAAEAGIAEVAAGSPEAAGGPAVSALRRRVWSRSLHEAAGTAASGPVPGERPTVDPDSGAAFALHGLGFLVEGAPVEVRGCRTWLRLSTPVGHVLTRHRG